VLGFNPAERHVKVKLSLSWMAHWGKGANHFLPPYSKYQNLSFHISIRIHGKPRSLMNMTLFTMPPHITKVSECYFAHFFLTSNMNSNRILTGSDETLLWDVLISYEY
jgi:hypothetical protein